MQNETGQYVVKVTVYNNGVVGDTYRLYINDVMYCERTWGIDPKEFCIVENMILALEKNVVYRPCVVGVSKNAKFEIVKVTVNNLPVDKNICPNFEFSTGIK